MEQENLQTCYILRAICVIIKTLLKFAVNNKERRNCMRTVLSLNDNWVFKKGVSEAPSSVPAWQPVSVPHTWNAYDGQDGDSNYYKGPCMYVREFWLPDSIDPSTRVYVEFMAVSSVATVYVNGQQVAYHKGGYSAFRADITDVVHTDEANLLCVCADNTIRTDVYPQNADFTFYGGMYRDVNLLLVSPTHFSLDYHGAPGIAVTAKPDGNDAQITVATWIDGVEAGDFAEFVFTNQESETVGVVQCPAEKETKACLHLENAHRWQGVEDPYLYRVTARVVRHNEYLDEVSTRFGIREFHVDPQKGFFLNGKLMPLRGVCRHQDRLGKGNALSKEEHYDDVRLIRELGANTIRLAHYQHNQYFYDACDEAGLVIWAEIPFISVYSKDPAGHENCRSQMTELIYQNYNHPCICFWGISNEITIGGDSEELVERLHDLNNLVHQLDPTRLTTMANVSMVPMDSKHNQITDVLSYNNYYGWYGGKFEDNEAWLDAFHKMHPDRAVGISEYGCEGIISYHSDEPKRRDYSEEYQCLYHEHMAKILHERPWIWATHLWNMFDFGCDARDEGGVKGRNNKGLMTLDRKIKKDAYFIYKAYWTTDPFVHICSSRYVLRTGESINVKVYSNCKDVTLYVNGEKFAALEGDKIFVFENVPLSAETKVTAVSGDVCDTATFRKVDEPYKPYFYEDPVAAAGAATVKNWFETTDPAMMEEITIDPTCYSANDTLNVLLENEESTAIVLELLGQFAGPRKGITGQISGQLSMLKNMLGNSDIQQMLTMLGSVSGVSMNADEMQKVINYANKKLQKIHK